MMKKQIKRLLWLLVALILLSPSLFFGGAREPQVLMYHFVRTPEEAKSNTLAVSKQTFEKQLRLLQAWGYRIYSMDEYYDIKTGKTKVAQKGVVLTFDDGNKDFYHTVFPIINEANVPVTNFLVSNNMAHESEGSMSFREARELLESPLVTFGVHTANHKVLKDLSEKELTEEIVSSKKMFEKALGEEMEYFCYPGGHFDEASYATVQKAGYKMAFTTSWKRLQGRDEDLYSIVRLKVSEKDSNPFIFWFKVSGVYSIAKELKFRFR